MKNFSEQKIITSWFKNVKPWVTAVRKGEIESRLLVTNQAIVDAVLESTPEVVLDVGCGEGWLVRELSKAGVKCMGVDITPELIKYAEKEGGGLFKAISFEDLSADILKEKFDVVVCNFSLLGNESVVHLFQQVPSLLKKDGVFIVQTIHPVAGCGKSKYKDGWRKGSWAGFSNNFSDPAPWYFRTLDTWKLLFIEHGLTLSKVVEPLNPKTQEVASIIFIGIVDNKYCNDP